MTKLKLRATLVIKVKSDIEIEGVTAETFHAYQKGELSNDLALRITDKINDATPSIGWDRYDVWEERYDVLEEA